MPRTTYRFGDCRVDVSARELRRAGELVVLSPKVFDCLAYLIERHDRAVGRDELVASVWGKTEITDTLLGQTILKARRAVGDSADEQNAIRTIPRFGYAWVAPLTMEQTDAPPTSSEETPAGATRLPRRRLALAALVALVVGLAWWAGIRFAQHREVEVVPVAAGAAAVLPVEVQAPAEWSWVRLGLMDAIATRLRDGAQPVVPSDNVIALTKTPRQDERLPDVRAATGATLLVVPSAAWNRSGWTVHLELQRDGSRIAVDAHDVDVLLAGRAASDRLLTALGKIPPPDANDPQGWADAKLLQRVEAAVLTDDLAGARRLLDSAPEALKQSAEYALRLAHVDFRAGEFEAADRRLRALLAQTSSESDPVLRARVLNGIGHAAIRLGHADAAKQVYGEAASLLQDRAEPDELGQAYMGRAIAAQVLGQDEESRAAYAKARVAFDIAGDALALARTEANEGMLEAARDRYAAAVGPLDRAAERFERFGTLNELAMASNVQIGAQLALLEPHAALAASDRAWPSRERLSNPRIRHALEINRALALEANGHRREAVALLEGVTTGADPAREKSVLASARVELARIALDSGQAGQAAELVLVALPTLIDGDDARGRAAAWLTGTRALRAAGRAKEAADQVARFADWARSSRQPAALRFAILAEAEQRAAQQGTAGPAGDASADYERALELASAGAVPADVVEVALSYGRHLIASGQTERATAVVGRVAQWAERDFGCALLQARLYSALGQRAAWEQALARARGSAGDREIPPDAALFNGGASSASL
ncbi:winged helix-turn-helix domain-containing protein [Dokdonella sp.]|uniref:winged helix-turn-helix domain-containing protein n=1 Tax=Dokdonella sp. TaxID=2291710 RepID=UPI001B2631EF|nr:winged helix-turn-helix domain-containing protein [Dokdonella sp.]MBO9662853.1 winged helix-turn-helix domain-containing protein [Dokdonella sp.]